MNICQYPGCDKPCRIKWCPEHAEIMYRGYRTKGMRKYRAENPDKIKEAQEKYRAAHPKIKAAQNRRYRESRTEEQRQADRDRRRRRYQTDPAYRAHVLAKQAEDYQRRAERKMMAWDARVWRTDTDDHGCPYLSGAIVGSWGLPGLHASFCPLG